MVPYVVGAMIKVTVLHVLLFVLHVCVMRGCYGVMVTEILVWSPEEVWLR